MHHGKPAFDPVRRRDDDQADKNQNGGERFSISDGRVVN